jgi:hypothetical protein
MPLSGNSAAALKSRATFVSLCVKESRCGLSGASLLFVPSKNRLMWTVCEHELSGSHTLK